MYLKVKDARSLELATVLQPSLCVGTFVQNTWHARWLHFPYVTRKFVTKPMSYVAALHLVPN